MKDKQYQGPDRRKADREAALEQRYTMFQLGGDVQRIFHGLEHIMAAIDDLRVKVEELQAAVDADQASDAAVVAAMQAEIDRLNALGTDGATAAEVAEIVSRLEGLIADVSGPNA